MKEASAIFQTGFQVGLEPDPVLNTAAEWLSQCYNVVPTKAGLEPRKDVFVPEYVAPADSYPFPLYFALHRFNVIVTSSQLIVFNEMWNETSRINHSLSSIPHFADFMDFFVVSGGDKRWERAFLDGKPVEALYGARFATCCNLRGQLVIGNCQLPNGPVLEDCSGKPTYTAPIDDCNIVAWSRIGEVNWDFELGNEVGWAPMPWQGCVLAVLPLGYEVVVYGSNGVAKLKPEDKPVPTYGIHRFGEPGVYSDKTVAGDSSQHLYLGTNFNLYIVEPERALSAEGKAPRKIGYKKFMEQLDDPHITFDPVNRQWWIGDGRKCFIYNGVGLCECSITPTHLNHLDGTLLGFAHTHGGDEAIVETSPLSFSSRGIKTLMNVESDVETTERQPVFGRASVKYHYEKEFRPLQDIILDPRGAFFPVAAGTELKVRYWTKNFRHFLLTKLWLHFKNTDKHFSRGVINAGATPE